MDSRRQWTAVLLLFIMGNGMVAQLRGVLLPNFQQTFDISEHLLGFVAPAGTVGLVVAVLTAGMLSGRLRSSTGNSIWNRRDNYLPYPREFRKHL